MTLRLVRALLLFVTLATPVLAEDYYVFLATRSARREALADALSRSSAPTGPI